MVLHVNAPATVALVLLTCGCLPSLFAAQPLPDQTTRTPDDELRAAEEQLAEALIASDTVTFEQLLADDFVLRGAPDVDRATWITNAVELCWGNRFDIADLSVRGRTDGGAVVTFVLTTYRDPITCEPAIVRSLVTDVWRRDADRWRLALRHSGPAGGAVAQQFTRIDPPPPRWEGTGELSLVGTGGNTDTQTAGIGASLLWRPGRWVSRARTAYVRSANAGVDTAESLVVEARQSYDLSNRVDLHGAASYLSDRFSGIDHRTTIDMGLGWLLGEGASQSFKVDVGAGVTREIRLASDDLTFPVGTIGALYRWRLSRTSDLTNQALVTADLSEAGNWRLQNSLNLTVTMTRLLSLKFGHELRRINQPVPGFRPTDTVTSAALVARF
jgi:putative salt-induced outer membrane protein